MARIKVISDGTPAGTRVIDEASGEDIENVTADVLSGTNTMVMRTFICDQCQWAGFDMPDGPVTYAPSEDEREKNG